MALGLKRRGKSQKVYVVTGDGELHEGANWEAFMFAAHNQLDNYTVIVDNNKYCMLGATENVVAHGSLKAKFDAFGFAVFEAENGNDTNDVCAALDAAKADASSKPKVIFAHTRKGRGVPLLESTDLRHVVGVNAETIDKLLLEPTS